MASKPSARNEVRSMLSGLFERGEEVVGVFLEELGKNPRVREQLGKTVERAVDAKRRVDRTTQTLLSALNVPSRADYNRLLAKIEALQGSLVNLSMKLDRCWRTSRRRRPRRVPATQPQNGGGASPGQRRRPRPSSVADLGARAARPLAPRRRPGWRASRPRSQATGRAHGG